MKIDSLNNEKIKYFYKLKQKKYRDESGLFIVEGNNLVEEAYKNGYLKNVLIEEGQELSFNFDSLFIVTKDIMKKLSDLDNPSKIIGICNKKEDKLVGNKLLLLDNLQDPGNLGTIIRSAVAFNIDTIVLGDNCVDLYNSKVIRSTQGMIFNINIVNYNLEELIETLKEKDYTIYGTKVTNGNSVKNIKVKDKYALIIGSEGKGVSESLLSLCDEYLYIDMNKKCESLNAAIAASIIMYELDK
jgi:TrmH family RNA methyltransferase